MKLSAPAGLRSKRKRMGRGQGSGKGCTCGRGSNGQKSRSGFSRQIGFEGGQMPLARRIPKGGFNNYNFRHFYQVINTEDLNRYGDGDTVDYNTLLKDRLVNKRSKFIKLLAKGELKKKVHVIVHKASQRAKELVEKSGGKVDIIV
jgi:large subunit ribosomal protein L15